MAVKDLSKKKKAQGRAAPLPFYVKGALESTLGVSKCQNSPTVERVIVHDRS